VERVERDWIVVLLAQLPFLLGPALMIVAATYAVLKGDFHSPEIALSAGVAVGMIAVYVPFHVYAARSARNAERPPGAAR
jgi:hypothetical protein